MGHAVRFARLGSSASVPALRRLRRHWGLLAVCALFLLAAAFVFDDYGVAVDEPAQYAIGETVFEYLEGAGDSVFDDLHVPSDRFYGPAFELSLALAGRMLGLNSYTKWQEVSRDVWLSRHYLTHLFFLAGGIFCYLLVLRMFGSRPLALVAMLLFLLHPRLYAHSYFNSKDLPFLAMFMIALYLGHRAFRRDTVGAFLLCGVGVGALCSLRPFGFGLFVALSGLLVLDLALAGNARGRGRVLLLAGAFAVAASLTYHVGSPYLWVDPIGRFSETLTVLSSHPNPAENFFRGEWLYAPDGPPFDYIPVWLGITTPPLVLLLALIGGGWLFRQAACRPRDIPRNTSLRFGLLVLLLFVAPIVFIPVMENNIYNGWRHVYFLYAPLVLLAVMGLRWILSSAGRRPMRVGALALAGAGVGVTVVSMARIHPLQDSYFNSLVDRTTPDRLVTQYQMEYWPQSYWNILRRVVQDHPDQKIVVSQLEFYRQIDLLPDAQMKWVSAPADAVYAHGFYSDQPVSRQVYSTKIYNNTIAAYRVEHLNSSDGAESIIHAAMSGDPIRTFIRTPTVKRSSGTFYLHENRIVYVAEEGCSEPRLGGYGIFHLFVRNRDRLPGQDKVYGFLRVNTNPDALQQLDDGRCALVLLLPDHPIVRVHAFRRGEATIPGLWNVWFGVTAPIDEAVLAGEPAASSLFDVFHDGDALVYVKDGCTDEEADREFLAQFFPRDPDALPDGIERDVFDRTVAVTTAFRLWDRGARFGDRCVARIALPPWPVASVRTGQYDETGWRWDVRFAVTPPAVDEAVLAGEPLVSSVFDIHLAGDALVYVRDGCTEADAARSFLLHFYPVDPGDLPDGSRTRGFENRDFGLWDHGARIDGRCLAVVPLPAYAVAGVRAGQYDDTGERWVVDFSLVRPDAMRASLTSEPVARSVFDVFHDGDALVYVRDGCTEEDANVDFFLHIVPVDVDDLPAGRREYGFDNRDFAFTTRGARMDGDCVAAVPLPGYSIASIRTGQYDATGDIWSVELALPDGE